MTSVGMTTSPFAGGLYYETLCVNAVVSSMRVMTSLWPIRTKHGSEFEFSLKRMLSSKTIPSIIHGAQGLQGYIYIGAQL